MLEEDAADRLHDGFGQPGGPRGVQDPQRGGERDWDELGFGGLRGELVPADHAVRGGATDVGDVDGACQGRQRVAELADGVGGAEFLAAVSVAVDGDQHDGFDLGESVEDGGGAEVRGAGRPDRAKGGGGQETDHGVDGVGDERHDPVAGGHTEPA